MSEATLCSTDFIFVLKARVGDIFERVHVDTPAALAQSVKPAHIQAFTSLIFRTLTKRLDGVATLRKISRSAHILEELPVCSETHLVASHLTGFFTSIRAR